MIIDHQDTKDLYSMEGETLKGIILESDESDNLVLVFDIHTIDISWSDNKSNIILRGL